MIARVDPPSAAPIMTIAAHPDDIESWCAGTLARSVDAGAVVGLLLVTSGEHGTDNPSDWPEAVAARRQEEALAAARDIGIAQVAFLHYPDGAVEDTHHLRGDLVAWIRQWRPAVVFTHDPEHPFPPYLCHRDHRVVGRAVLDAIYPLARDPLSFPEHLKDGPASHAVGEAWLFATANPTVSLVDISDTFERKVTARLAHRSQTPDPERLREDWRERAARIGAPAGLPLAEAFHVLRIG